MWAVEEWEEFGRNTGVVRVRVEEDISAQFGVIQFFIYVMNIFDRFRIANIL